jgi:hypothetical protein
MTVSKLIPAGPLGLLAALVALFLFSQVLEVTGTNPEQALEWRTRVLAGVSYH